MEDDSEGVLETTTYSTFGFPKKFFKVLDCTVPDHLKRCKNAKKPPDNVATLRRLKFSNCGA